MQRLVIRVWAVLPLVLFSSWGEPTAEAQLFRGRRQQRCCPAPCQCDCCATRSTPGLCIKDELFGSTGYWLYLAHYHEVNTDCPNYIDVFYESTVQYPQMLCHEECFDPWARGAAASMPGLPAPIDATEDLMRLMTNSKATKIKELASDLKLPDGREIHARIGLFEITVSVKVDGAVKDVTEYFGFGFESLDTGKDEFHALEVSKHLVGSEPQPNLTEFKIGTLKCVVLTVKQ